MAKSLSSQKRGEVILSVVFTLISLAFFAFVVLPGYFISKGGM